MKQHQLLLFASFLAVVLSAVIIFRAVSAKSQFDRSVREALKTSEGYDQRFIDMVNRLEDILATRAQFGYTGGKDPMTGTKRQVVQPKTVKTGKGRKHSVRPASVAGTETAPPAETDPVKLTAIIADASGKKITAVIMDGERSLSVDPGDRVAGRTITKITNDGIYMETSDAFYFYDIYGNVVKKDKVSGSVSSFIKDEAGPDNDETTAAPGKGRKKR